MLTYCNTARGRVACGLGGVLIAVLALACLWTFSPSVTAGDDPLPPVKKRTPEPSKPDVCPKADIPSLPPVVETKSGRDVKFIPPPPPPPPPLQKTEVMERDVVLPANPPPLKSESSVPPPLAPLKGEKQSTGPSPVETEKSPAPLPPMDTPPPPPAGPITQVSGSGVSSPVSPPIGAVGGAIIGAGAAAAQAQPPVDNQDIKQLVAHLTEIRADRAKLDDKERQTILTIKRKYQEQKQALEQMERELRQLGINFDDTTSDKASVPDLAPRPKTVR
jgi:hypothetical protein